MELDKKQEKTLVTRVWQFATLHRKTGRRLATLLYRDLL